MNLRTLEGWQDERGGSWSLPEAALAFLGSVRELHAVTSLPGAVRGNHYHPGRRECLLIVHQDRCRVAWAGGPDEAAEVYEASGEGALLLEIEAGEPHAVENHGAQPLLLVSCSNGRPEERQVDTLPHRLLGS